MRIRFLGAARTVTGSQHLFTHSIVKIFGEPVERRAEVATIGGFSAHAGQDFLCEYARAGAGGAQSLFLIHGEPKAALPFQDALKSKGFTTPIYYPEMGESAEFA